MKFGIIAEGVSDVAVIENILIGLGLIEKQSDVVPLRPEMNVDSYDLNNKTVDEFSNWTLVKEECINRIKFNRFLGIENILDVEKK